MDTPLGMLAIWEVLKQQIAVEGTLTEATMQDMNSLFQKLLPNSLEIIDNGFVHKVVAECGRTMFIVKGRSQAQYVCFGDYCPCQYFQNSVVNGESLFCKHMLAIQLRELLCPPLEATVVSNADFASYVTAPIASTSGRSPVRRRMP